jgi:hypothetical protein
MYGEVVLGLLHSVTRHAKFQYVRFEIEMDCTAFNKITLIYQLGCKWALLLYLVFVWVRVGMNMKLKASLSTALRAETITDQVPVTAFSHTASFLQYELI